MIIFFKNKFKVKKIISILLLIINLHAIQAAQLYDKPEVKKFIATMVEKNKFNKEQLELLFQATEVNQEVLNKIKNPYEAKSWDHYKKTFLDSARIKAGKTFTKQYNLTLQQAEERFKVPKEIITAILGVETRYGTNTGRFPVFQAIATIAFNYEKRAQYFIKELEELFILAREEKINILDLMGSYAGAMGAAQFMPSSYRAYAVDFAACGKKDLKIMPNAIGSIANYLKMHGWTNSPFVALAVQVKDKATIEALLNKEFDLETFKNNGIILKNKKSYEKTTKEKFKLIKVDSKTEAFWLVNNNFKAIMKYNNSPNYALAVYFLSEKIKHRNIFSL